MKRIIQMVLLSALCALIPGSAVLSQVRTAERILQQQKVRFFNENLQLTPAESEKFWPIYNDYQNRRDRITAERNNLLRYFQSNNRNMSPAEANEAIDKYLSYQLQETELLETYTTRFREFLPPNKVMQIFIVELEFKKWLLENLRENRVQTTPRN